MKVIKQADKATASDATIKGETPAPAAPGAPTADIDAVLQGLDKSAAATEGASQQAEAKQDRQELDTVKADILDLLDLAAKPAKPLMHWLTPEQFEQLWGKEKREQIAEPLAAIARRNGWDMRGALNDYGPYAMLAMALGPSVFVTYKVRQQQKQFFAEQAAQGGAPAAAVKAADGNGT